MQPLSFEEWERTYIGVDPLLVTELRKHHIDADEVIKKVAHNEYELYVAIFNRDFNNSHKEAK